MVERAKRRLISSMSLFLGTLVSLFSGSKIVKAQTHLPDQDYRKPTPSEIKLKDQAPLTGVEAASEVNANGPAGQWFVRPTASSIKLREQVPLTGVEAASEVNANGPAGQWFVRPSATHLKALREGRDRSFEAFVIQQGFQLKDLNNAELEAAFTEFKLIELEKRLDQIEAQMNR